MEVSSGTPSAVSCPRKRNLMGFCRLSVVTYNIILCRCTPPGTPGAPYIFCTGDWASDWSRLHSSPRRSCPAGTQGDVLFWPRTPYSPAVFRKKDLWFNSSLRRLSYTLLLLPGNPAGQLLRSTRGGIGGPGLEAARPSAADDHPRPEQDPVRVCPADALCCQGRRGKSKGTHQLM